MTRDVEKDIENMYEEICYNNEWVSKKDLADRFIEMTNRTNKESWTLLQILANINIVLSDERERTMKITGLVQKEADLTYDEVIRLIDIVFGKVEMTEDDVKMLRARYGEHGVLYGELFDELVIKKALFGQDMKEYAESTWPTDIEW